MKAYGSKKILNFWHIFADVIKNTIADVSKIIMTNLYFSNEEYVC